MILWGIAGKPEPTIENPFTDVREGKWYYSAVLWAKETGLTDGKTPTTFAPNDTCTRAEAVFFIWKYFGSEIVSKAERVQRSCRMTAPLRSFLLWGRTLTRRFRRAACPLFF